ncbi:MAG: M20/M25/M40 family metallo-hydrolase [Planctomycetes bacterium]|nr:M20/M25/M40 family metallo-hydrolase [Planctomycetota bacterium]
MSVSATEQRLCEVIARRRDALLDDLRLHVGIPTGGANSAGLDESRERFSARCMALGATPTLTPGTPRPSWLTMSLDDAAAESPSPPTALLSRTANRSGLKLLLSGHLDTVHEPSSPFRSLTLNSDGKTATGPGCVDMKGGLVIAMAALEALDEIGASVAWSFILNSDEETGSYHSDDALRQAGAQHDVGLALEPALPDGSLVVERPGSGQFMLEARGRAAHVGRDFTSGVSAINALSHSVLDAAKIADPANGLICSIGRIIGGVAPNVVPDHARAWGNVRYFTAEAESLAAAQLDALASSGSNLPSVTVHRSFNRPAKPLTPGTQKLADLTRAVATDLGQTMPFAKTGGVCDGNNLQAAGCPTIDTLGVRGGGLHTPQEWIDLSSLVERCQLLAILMHRLSQRESL